MAKLLTGIATIILQLIYAPAMSQDCNCPVRQVLIYQFNLYRLTPSWFKGQDVDDKHQTKARQYS